MEAHDVSVLGVGCAFKWGKWAKARESALTTDQRRPPSAQLVKNGAFNMPLARRNSRAARKSTCPARPGSKKLCRPTASGLAWPARPHSKRSDWRRRSTHLLAAVEGEGSQPRAGPGTACRGTSGRILAPRHRAGPGKRERGRGPLQPACPGATPGPRSYRFLQALRPRPASQRARPGPSFSSSRRRRRALRAPQLSSARLSSAQLLLLQLQLCSAPLH